MKKGYWTWLTKNLKIAWEWTKIIPFAIWDFAKWISNDLRKMTFSFIKNEVGKMFSWENICAVTGAVFGTGLILGVMFLFPVEAHKYIFPWIIFELVFFLISTYAYWRDKP